MRLLGYRYITEPTDCSFEKCDVCEKTVKDGYIQIEEREYEIRKENFAHRGWTRFGCDMIFGHKDCLMHKRKNGIYDGLEETK